METNIVKKVNFREFEIKFDLDGKTVREDARKVIGNFIYQNSHDLGVFDLSNKIYHSDGEIELTHWEITTIKELVEKSYMILPIKLALLNL